MLNLRVIASAALLWLTSLSAHALCPDGAIYDAALSACVNSSDAFGPFTDKMVGKCQAAGGGQACTKLYPYLVSGHTINVLRWSKSFTASLRGTAACPDGSVFSPSYGNNCFEQRSGTTNNVFGNFSAAELSACISLSGGSSCYTNRWEAGFYNSVQSRLAASPPSGGTFNNKYGAWLWYADGIGKTHVQIADQLKAQGVKRIFIKIADNTQACSVYTDACLKATTDTYKARGIEPWAWAYNYPNNSAAQADALYQAARFGYVGFVSDVEVEFDRKSTELSALFQAFVAARERAKTDGWIAGAATSFPLGATTWGNPADHGMRVDIIDQYVAFHMPQTYLEVWGPTYMADPKKWIETTNCEYRNLGANKPIWNIVSTEQDVITSAQLELFMAAAGPNASIWRIPGGGTPTSIWNDWAGINWERSSFVESACGTGNNLYADYLNQGSPVPPTTVPYWNQNSNAVNPSGTCSTTSVAMLTDFYGITTPSTIGGYARTPDYLINRFGVGQTVPALAAIFNTMAAERGSAVRDSGTTTGTIEELRARASQGKPTIVHGWFTSSGHIMVVTGFDGANYIVNDPYGKWGLVTGSYDTSISGKGQKYPKADFDRVITDNGLGNDLWLHRFD
ncbi:C39 family peptidase [Roseateles violae]|uniref:C39 family peptidase n=1 Tax=Roseateles violae TaxID=3058042 RepID=A0ABT8DPP0_9BURK|nr:C39 family peptidase [Pelomonas sp. PFR6]MDN3920319.1 C39 family peptidase [Pelomonas sp. PFR6]